MVFCWKERQGERKGDRGVKRKGLRGYSKTWNSSMRDDEQQCRSVRIIQSAISRVLSWGHNSHHTYTQTKGKDNRSKRIVGKEREDDSVVDCRRSSFKQIILEERTKQLNPERCLFLITYCYPVVNDTIGIRVSLFLSWHTIECVCPLVVLVSLHPLFSFSLPTHLHPPSLTSLR